MPPRTCSIRCAAAGLAVTLLAGCGTYMETKRDNRPGGRLDQEKAAATKDLETAKAQNVDLSDAAVQRKREIARMEARLGAMSDDLKKQDAALADAVKAKRLSQERYNQLKRQLDGLRSETQELELQNKSSAMGKPDPAADAAKQTRLAELEKKKKDLEGALIQMNVKR